MNENHEDTRNECFSEIIETFIQWSCLTSELECSASQTHQTQGPTYHLDRLYHLITCQLHELEGPFRLHIVADLVASYCF